MKAQLEINEQLPIELPLKSAVKIYARRLGIFLLVIAGNLLIFGTIFLLSKLSTQLIVLLGVAICLMSLVTLLVEVSRVTERLIIAVTSSVVFLLYVVVSIRTPLPKPPFFNPYLGVIPLPNLLVVVGIFLVLLSLQSLSGALEGMSFSIGGRKLRYGVGVLGILIIALALLLVWLQV